MRMMRVSILTRPEGRVQRTPPAGEATAGRFQSSPVPKDGCNRRGCWQRAGRVRFQSSPVPKDGCNAHGEPHLVRLVDEFQSSPVPKDGCNWQANSAVFCAKAGFNPHPSRRTGATSLRCTSEPRPMAVSILTRPEGRVQRSRHSHRTARACCFNPHPSRRTGATGVLRLSGRKTARFNPHPSRRTGATVLWRRR